MYTSSVQIVLQDCPSVQLLGIHRIQTFYKLKKKNFVVVVVVELFTTALSKSNFSRRKFGLPSPGKASCDRVVLPNQGSMLGVLVFP